MNCMEAIDVMEEAAEGRLAPEVRASFEEHLADCGPCGTYFRQLGITREALKGLRKASEAGPIRQTLIDAFQEEHRRDHD